MTEQNIRHSGAENNPPDSLADLEGLEILAKDYESNLRRDYSFACYEAMSFAAICRQQIEIGDHEGAFHSTQKFRQSASEVCRLMRRLDENLKREGSVK